MVLRVKRPRSLPQPVSGFCRSPRRAPWHGDEIPLRQRSLIIASVAGQRTTTNYVHFLTIPFSSMSVRSRLNTSRMLFKLM
jgi:hypothetical protein